MKIRKAKDIEKALLKKGFHQFSTKAKSHHSYYYFVFQGKKSHIYTYLSHGPKSEDYGKNLMSQIKKELKFDDSNKADRFFDCPMTEEEYIKMLQTKGEL